MIRLPLSKAASALLRALLNRSGVARDRILLSEYGGTDWQSLTFIGGRHEFALRIAGPGADQIVEALTGNLDEAEFQIKGQTVADIIVPSPPQSLPDGSISLRIEALTIED